MDFDDLRCFVAAAESDTFRAASRRVALSPGAFSDRIKRLEGALDQELFARTTRQVHLTEAGLRLLPHAREVLEGARRCEAVARGEIGTAPYELTLGTRFELGLSWLVPNLSQLERSVPERTLHLYMGDTPELMGRVERGEIDAVVSSNRLVSPRVAYAVLHPETYRFVGAPGQPLCESPEDARGRTLLDVSPDLPLLRYLIDADRGSRWPFARYQYLGGIGAIRLRAREGAGVAVLPEYFVQRDLELGTLIDLSPERTLTDDVFRLIWRRGHPLEERLRALGRELHDLPLS